jgi:hypothetical protein
MILILLLVLKWLLITMGAIVLAGVIVIIAVACLDYQVDQIIEKEKEP